MKNDVKQPIRYRISLLLIGLLWVGCGSSSGPDESADTPIDSGEPDIVEVSDTCSTETCSPCPEICDGDTPVCDEASQLCKEGDVWFADCVGAPTSMKESCGTCGCSEGACTPSQQAGVICHEGDAFWTDCDGNITTKKDECGICGCTEGGCEFSDQAAAICDDGDA